MSDLNVIRPILADAILKFRFNSASLILRHMANGDFPNGPYLKILANTYDNLHIFMSSPDRNFLVLRNFVVPIIPEKVEISQIERMLFENEVRKFQTAVKRIEDTPNWLIAGDLLKSYYCLSNGFNFGSLTLMASSLRRILDAGLGFQGAEGMHASILNYGSSIIGGAEGSDAPALSFSFYHEYDRLRVWIKEELEINIYELQKDLSPNFRFGG